MTYEAAVAALGRALQFGINPSLDGIRALADALGRPQDAFKAVQVTGTNGKTSVTRMTAAILSAHGRRAAAYTSPHLVSYTERLEIDGRAVSEADFALGVAAALEAASSVGGDFTEFELLTAAAMWLCRERDVEWACLEVGMGGRWDATSVVGPAVAVITGIALDHTDRLGKTREEIAADKSHIIKPGAVSVLGPGCAGVEAILLERALAVAAPTVRVGQGEDDVAWIVTEHPRTPGGTTRLDVMGALAPYPAISLRAPSYQAANAATAVAAAEAALGPLDETAVRSAFATLTFPGRFEVLGTAPTVVIDGAHNPDAARVLAGAIAEAFGDRRPTVVIGVFADKDAEGIVLELAPVASAFVVTQNASSRALPAAELAGIVERVTGATPEIEPAIERAIALASRSDVGVVVTGSLYTAGAARKLLAG